MGEISDVSFTYPTHIIALNEVTPSGHDTQSDHRGQLSHSTAWAGSNLFLFFRDVIRSRSRIPTGQALETESERERTPRLTRSKGDGVKRSNPLFSHHRWRQHIFNAWVRPSPTIPGKHQRAPKQASPRTAGQASKRPDPLKHQSQCPP